MRQMITKLFFPAVIVLMLAAGLICTVFFPQEINEYENRYNAQLPPLTLSGYMTGEFQDSMEEALADQVPFSQQGKQFYNRTTTAYERLFLQDILQNIPDRYVHYRDMLIYGSDTFVYTPRVLDDVAADLDARIDNLNSIFAQFPDTTFYAYYVENDTDYNFELGRSVDISAYVIGHLNLDTNHLGSFCIENFDSFRDHFYRTDHHWNHNGSYAGYLDLHNLLGITDSPMAPVGSYAMQAPMTGSRCLASGSELFEEAVTVHEYDWPHLDCYINGEPADDYGAQDPAAHTMPNSSYSTIYGVDAGELILSSGTSGRGSLLVIGDSYDNAVLKLLATHYDVLYAIDLRYYEAHMGQAFHLGQYLDTHATDQVLLIGSGAYYLNTDFNLNP